MSVAAPKTSTGVSSAGKAGGLAGARVSALAASEPQAVITVRGVTEPHARRLATAPPGAPRAEGKSSGLTQAEEGFVGRELEAAQAELAQALSRSRGATEELRRIAHS